jgi:hypothetical protein
LFESDGMDVEKQKKSKESLKGIQRKYLEA